MKKLYKIILPENFSPIAKAAFHSLEGSLYAADGKLVFTDETESLESPQYTAVDFEQLERWLLQCAASWIAKAAQKSDTPDDVMLIALEEHLNFHR